MNAGDQVYRVCNEVQKNLDDYLINSKIKKPFPPVLSFASIMDATVTVSDTVNNLYNRLPDGNHSLVLFDINNIFNSNHFIKRKVTTAIQKLRESPVNPNYTFDFITDMNATYRNIMQIRTTKSNRKITEILPFRWPKGIYSLSHLAMPISNNDPLYGDENAPKSPGIQLGYLAVYGETSVLETSAS